MTVREQRQRRNRFTFYIIFLLFSMALCYWSGYSMGRTVTKVEYGIELDE